MDAVPDLQIRVISFDYRPIQRARVTVQSAADGAVANAATGADGRLRFSRADDSDVRLRVEAPGLEPEVRIVAGGRPERVELFILGRPGMNSYFRRTVRVPFEPIPRAVGVLMRERGSQADSVPREIDYGEITARVRRLVGSVDAELLRWGGNFTRSGVFVVGSREVTGERILDDLLGRLADRDDIEHAGALVRLSARHASFLTQTVIAHFADGVEDTTVADIAGRHGLTPLSRFGDLGNVYRLRFPGLATYAVLEASNALAAEPEVIWSEPDLVHTAEDDAVIPADFLFPEQWDHRIINTPDAWQALRDNNPAESFGSPDVSIAIVDGGVDVTHPEFLGVVSSGQPKVYQQFDFATMVANMNSLDGDHGTGCASASTARSDNASTVAGVDEGVSGVAGNCRLIAIRHGGTEARYAEMYLWAAGFAANSPSAAFPPQISPGADVITNSFGISVGIPISGLMSLTFDRLTDHGRGGRGVLLFFSAGNENADLEVTFNRPWSMYDRCFCVAASTVANNGIMELRPAYSSFGATVDFCAPSDDNQGPHDPPAAYGAHTATILSTPKGHALPGHPDIRTSLTAAAAAGAVTVVVGTVAGLAANQAMLIEAPGAAGAEGRQITAIDVSTRRVSFTPALRNAHAAGTVVAVGPRSYRSNFGGTSYATPVCAGTGALMLSANPLLHWTLVRDILRDTAVKIDPGNSNATGRWRDSGGRISTNAGYTGPLFSKYYGYGRIDAARAVRAALSAPR